MREILLLLILAMNIPLYGQIIKQQEKKIPNHFSIEFEVGSNTIQGDINQNLSIRNGVENYEGIDRVDITTLHTGFGIKPQYTILDDRLTFATGLRLHILDTKLEGLYGNKQQHYLFLNYQKNDEVLKLARVESIDEKTYYMGVPLEAKYVPIRSGWFSIYLKAGAEIGFQLKSDLELNLLDQSMNKYPKETFLPADIIKGPNGLYSSIYSSLGMSLTFDRKFNVNVEMLMPRILTNNNVTLRNQKSMGGIQFSITIPINHNKKDTNR